MSDTQPAASTAPQEPPVDLHRPAEPAGSAPASAVPAPADADLPALLESLLFVAPSPIALVRLAQALGVTEEAVEDGLARLSAGQREGRRGLHLLRKGDRVHLTSAPEAAPYIERLLGLDLNTKLSQAALEALAVIAYRQPLDACRNRGDPRRQL